jgi:hypothetical protein
MHGACAQQSPTLPSAARPAVPDPLAALPQQPAGQARVIFYRRSSFVGVAAGARIKIDGKTAAWLDSGTAVFIDHAAGEVQISIDSPWGMGEAAFTLNLKPDRQYFVPLVTEGSGALGAMLNTQHISHYCGGGWCADVVNKAEALPAISTLSLSGPNPNAE